MHFEGVAVGQGSNFAIAIGAQAIRRAGSFDARKRKGRNYSARGWRGPCL
jgi:hypothetical protein